MDTILTLLGVIFLTCELREFYGVEKINQPFSVLFGSLIINMRN